VLLNLGAYVHTEVF